MWSCTFYVISVLVVLAATDWQVERRPRFLDLDWIQKSPKNATKIPYWMPIHTKFQCERTGFFPDKVNCKQFYRCLSFLTGYFLRHAYLCDGNRVYSTKQQNCVNPENNDRPECVVGLKESSKNRTSTPSVQGTKELDDQELPHSDDTTPYEDSDGLDVEHRTAGPVSLVKRDVGDNDFACHNANEENSEESDDAFVDAPTDLCPTQQRTTVHIDATTQGSRAQVDTMKEQNTNVQVDTTTQQSTMIQTDTTAQSITMPVGTAEEQSTIVQGLTEEDIVVQDSTEEDIVVQDSTEEDIVVQNSTEEQSLTEEVRKREELVTEEIDTTEQITQEAYSFETSEKIRHDTEEIQTTEESTTHIGMTGTMATRLPEITDQSTIEHIDTETKSIVQQTDTTTTDILKDNVESTTVTEMSQKLGTEMERVFESTTVNFEEDGSSDKTILTSLENAERNDEHKEEICVAEGFFADPNNCSKFYRCVRFGFMFLKHEFTCAAGTIWDDRLKTCNFLHGIELENRSCKYDPTFTTQNRQTETKNKFSIGDLIRDQLTFVCPTGIRRHSNYCNLFYQCILNDRFQLNFTAFACPEGTFFNEERVRCLESKEDEDCVNFQIDEERNRIEILHLLDRDLCPDEGRFPYGVCSSRYLQCVRNMEGELEGYLFDCPPGHVYSPLTIGCLPSATVQACVH